jgi:hypothetical protein
MPIYNESYHSGLTQEQLVLPIILDYFNRDIKPIAGRFSQHDFECDNYTYELKSRTNKKDKFNDTLIGLDKLNNLSKPLVLLFSFTDCLCYVEYNETQFETYKKSIFGRLDRPYEEAKAHVYIPIKDLIKIKDW